jgi:hypothetical protein
MLSRRCALEPSNLLAMQRLAGNGACASLMGRSASAAGGPAIAQRVLDQEGQDTGDGTEIQGLIRGASAVLGAGPAVFGYFPADPQFESSFVMFDDVNVQKLFRYLLAHWFGDARALEDSPGLEQPPLWVAAFRDRALNVRPQPSAEGQPGEEAQLAALALQLAGSVVVETPAQKIRRQFVAAADKRVGTTVMTQEAIEAQRSKAAGKGITPENFTTCIEFFGQVVSQVTKEAGLAGPLLHAPNSYVEINAAAKAPAYHLGDAWIPGTPDVRPRPGDVLIFLFNEDVIKGGKVKYGKGWFSHISILRSIEPAEAGEARPAEASAAEPAEPATRKPPEKWVSIDGGGTTAGEVARTFYPDSGLIKGPGSVMRVIKGWINIEKAAEAGLARKG